MDKFDEFLAAMHEPALSEPVVPIKAEHMELGLEHFDSLVVEQQIVVMTSVTRLATALWGNGIPKVLLDPYDDENLRNVIEGISVLLIGLTPKAKGKHSAAQSHGRSRGKAHDDEEAEKKKARERGLSSGR